MREESNCLVSAENEDAIVAISNLWDDKCDILGCTFECFSTDVLDVMEQVIKLVYAMEAQSVKYNFTISGKCESDYDCNIFTIEYSGDQPYIKASQADPEENERRFYQFSEAKYSEIPALLKRNKKRTFAQAIRDDIPLGGFIDGSYEEWVASIKES